MIATDAEVAVRPPDVAAAKEIIAAALHAAEGFGVDRRHFKTGLWQSLIGTMLAAADARTVIRVLEHQVSRLHGYGSNADSGAIEETEEDLSVRLSSASDVAAILADHFSGFLEVADDAGVDGILLMVSVGFGVLAESWGPDFLRRNIQQQIQALQAGADGPIMPVEPLVANRQPDKRRPPPGSAAPPPLAGPEPRPSGWMGRQVHVRVLAGTHPSGFAVFSAALDITAAAPERRQRIDLVGTIEGAVSIRIAWLTGCLEALLAVPCGAVEQTSIVAEDFLSAELGKQASWPAAEKDLWVALNAQIRDRTISWNGSCETEDDFARNSRCEAAIKDWIARR